MKQPFQFRLPDGTVGTATCEQDLIELGVLEERKAHFEAHLVSEMHYEREWRNKELDLTDKLMQEDSRYNGKYCRCCEYYQEIREYRYDLMEYDLKYMQRPVRPEWFTG